MNIAELQTLLAVINGVWGLLAFALALVTVVYVYQEGTERRLTIRQWLFGMPLGMRVAVAIMIIAFGVVLTRGTIWVWRTLYGGGPFTQTMLALLLTGAVLGAVGFLCAIREISKPLYGDWPWLAALVACAGFLTFSIWIH